MSKSGIVEWITAENAAERIGRSVRQLERLMVKEDLKTKLEPVAGRKPRRLFFAADVERVAATAEGRKRIRVQAIKDPSVSRAGMSPEVLELFERFLREMLATRQSIAARDATARREPKLWLSVEQAAEYSGLTQRDIRDLAAAGEITARRSGRSLRIRRLSLEAFGD